MSESQTIESATTSLSAQPDNRTRRYDRQLRLWAASGQSALESARILVLGADATSTAILKNLVLPGVGHFTLVDDALVTPADAGNNFFLEGYASVSKNRAEEAVRLLLELNEGVRGEADTRGVEEVVGDEEWVKGFTIVIAHNLRKTLLDQLAAFLWADALAPPLIVVRSAGFLAEFFIQFHEHTIIESHLDLAPTLRISSPFPSLLSAAQSIPFSTLDATDHSHIPYPLILVHALAAWRTAHAGQSPSTSADKDAFKRCIRGMKKKSDEENFEEAEAQAWRVWTSSGVPRDIQELFRKVGKECPAPQNGGFYALVKALERFTKLDEYKGLLPLSGAVPDMKADTEQYIALQHLYKAQAEEEKAVFMGLLDEVLKEQGLELDEAPFGLDDASISTFIKNAHALRALSGEKWGAVDERPDTLSKGLRTTCKEMATHLALSALAELSEKDEVTQEGLYNRASKLLSDAQELSNVPEFTWASGEIVRAPRAELPNTAAFLGGMIAQETIKMVTRQYVPVCGTCVVDLIGSWTGVMAS